MLKAVLMHISHSHSKHHWISYTLQNTYIKNDTKLAAGS